MPHAAAPAQDEARAALRADMAVEMAAALSAGSGMDAAAVLSAATSQLGEAAVSALMDLLRSGSKPPSQSSGCT